MELFILERLRNKLLGFRFSNPKAESLPIILSLKITNLFFFKNLFIKEILSKLGYISFKGYNKKSN